MYSIHRIIGIDKMRSFKDHGRFAIIFQYKQHIIIYAILAGIASIIFYYSFLPKIKWMLLGVIILSAAYVFPVFGKRRLRDLFRVTFGV